MWQVVGTNLLHNVRTCSGVIVFLSRVCSFFPDDQKHFFFCPACSVVHGEITTCVNRILSFFSTPAHVNYTLHAWGDYQQSSRFQFETRKAVTVSGTSLFSVSPLRAAALAENASLTGKKKKKKFKAATWLLPEDLTKRRFRPQKLLFFFTVTGKVGERWHLNIHSFVVLKVCRSAPLTKMRTKEMFARANDKGRYKARVIQN